MIEGAVRIIGGREKKLQHGYPWVQRGEISEVSGAPTPGALVRVLNFRGELLGIGTYNPQSRFPVRILTTCDEPIDETFFATRLERALRYRERVVSDTNAMRLLFSESDGVPGLIVDQYADYLVVQVRSLGMERLKEFWLPVLIERLEPKGIIERSEMAGRSEEGLEPFAGVLHGEVPELIEIEESGLQFLVPTDAGRKTGFYLDQRENRRRLAQRVRPGERVLDLFCYTGAFALYAARAGAYAVGVDILPDAIDLAEVHARRNNLQAHWIVENAFDWLPQAAEQGARFDWIVMDPPAIAKRQDQKDSLRWAIWKLVYNALPLLAEGGRIAVCSCAYTLTLDDMFDAVRLAATDRRQPLYLEEVTFQAPDHPYLIQFPESLYLKCLWVRL
ncbi:MAG: class I SAM-dependent rRNA methyltransferase [Fimbriimonadales bacterium]|nr:class I SAM-dependent rRNA methyltransferase [Fimbriimonadales bacterium]